jgi:hypothetical protein
MYHLLKGLHTYLTRKDEYSVVIIGLDNVSLALSVFVSTRMRAELLRLERRSVLSSVGCSDVSVSCVVPSNEHGGRLGVDA